MPRKAPLNPCRVDMTPVFACIRDWCALSGMSPVRTYEALGRGDLRAKKLGEQTLIDVQHGLEYLRSLPDAKIYTKTRHLPVADAVA